MRELSIEPDDREVHGRNLLDRLADASESPFDRVARMRKLCLGEALLKLHVHYRTTVVSREEATHWPAPHEVTASDFDLGKLSIEERQVFSEIARALKTMRYGSIVLTVHDGHLVELSKTVRLRTRPTKEV